MNSFRVAPVPGHILRHPTPEDADAVLAVIVARDVADLGRPDYTLEDLHADWTLPGIDPRLDAWVVPEGERLVGYAFLDDRGAALVSVAPDAEGRGIGTALRGAAEARAAARGEALVRQYVPVANEQARALLLEAGYWPVHHYFRMRIGLAAAPPPPAEVPVRRFDPERDAPPVHALVQDAFAQLEGNVPQTLDAWRAAKIAKRGWDPALWLLAEDDDGLAGRRAVRALGGRCRLRRLARGGAARPRPRSRPRAAAARVRGAARGRRRSGRAVGAGRECGGRAALRGRRHALGVVAGALGESAGPRRSAVAADRAPARMHRLLRRRRAERPRRRTKPDGTWDLYNGLAGPKRTWFGVWDHVRGNSGDPSVKLESYRADAPFEVPTDTLAEGTDPALSIPTVSDCA